MSRWLAALLLALAVLTLPLVARAGSYVDRAAMLLEGSQSERDAVRPRVQDEELVELVHDISAARVLAARKMKVPPAVANAHPHLLLVLENTERAFAAALAGNLEKFLMHLMRARDEDATFRSIMSELGYTVPGKPVRR
jgi:hypothetical protein